MDFGDTIAEVTSWFDYPDPTVVARIEKYINYAMREICRTRTPLEELRGTAYGMAPTFTASTDHVLPGHLVLYSAAASALPDINMAYPVSVHVRPLERPSMDYEALVAGVYAEGGYMFEAEDLPFTAGALLPSTDSKYYKWEELTQLSTIEGDSSFNRADFLPIPLIPTTWAIYEDYVSKGKPQHYRFGYRHPEIVASTLYPLSTLSEGYFMRLYPIPDELYAVRLDYQKMVNTLAMPGDTAVENPLLANYHELVVTLTLSKLYAEIGDVMRSRFWLQEYHMEWAKINDYTRHALHLPKRYAPRRKESKVTGITPGRRL